jgi:hypothetical protein
MGLRLPRRLLPFDRAQGRSLTAPREDVCIGVASAIDEARELRKWVALDRTLRFRLAKAPLELFEIDRMTRFSGRFTHYPPLEGEGTPERGVPP